MLTFFQIYTSVVKKSLCTQRHFRIYLVKVPQLTHSIVVAFGHHGLHDFSVRFPGEPWRWALTPLWNLDEAALVPTSMFQP